MIRALVFAKFGINFGARQFAFVGGMPIKINDSQDRSITVGGEDRSLTVSPGVDLFGISLEQRSLTVGAEQRQNVVAPSAATYNVSKGTEIFVI